MMQLSADLFIATQRCPGQSLAIYEVDTNERIAVDQNNSLSKLSSWPRHTFKFN